MSEPHTRTVLSDRAATVCERCQVANTAVPRMKGLLGRKRLAEEEGLLLTPAPSIHTWFMRFPIDVVFLDRDLEVIDVVEALRPWRAAGRRGARAVLELAAGRARRCGLRIGDKLSLVAPGSIQTPVVFVRAGSAT
ncbi:MAG TPA: DUF192 domain-containing protein [Thermoleophilaceae bacterium]